jgi:hypothetical protein
MTKMQCYSSLVQRCIFEIGAIPMLNTVKYLSRMLISAAPYAEYWKSQAIMACPRAVCPTRGTSLALQMSLIDHNPLEVISALELFPLPKIIVLGLHSYEPASYCRHCTYFRLWKLQWLKSTILKLSHWLWFAQNLRRLVQQS